MIEDIDNKTVAEVVSENIRTADVFKKNGIDFCCGGKVNIREICDKKGVNYQKVKEEVLEIDKPKSRMEDFNSWELDFLVDYITNVHHKYVLEANGLLEQYASKVAKVHGHYYTEIPEIYNLFKGIKDELTSHMRKEEMILFPYIKNLVMAKKASLPIETPPFGTIQNPINMMHAEHDEAGEVIRRIAELSNNFTPPAEACNTFRALYSKLEEYQNDLFQHIHLENNILFPKAIQLEQELLSA